jgi:hypothetical protein
MLSALFALFNLTIRSHAYVQATLDLHSPMCASHVCGMTDVSHHVQLFIF